MRRGNRRFALVAIHPVKAPANTVTELVFFKVCTVSQCPVLRIDHHDTAARVEVGQHDVDAAPAAHGGRGSGGVDIVLTYFHPELVVVVNPKNRAHWETVRTLKKNELVTVFAAPLPGRDGDKKYETAISLLITLIEGGKAKTPPTLQKGCVRRQEVGAPSTSGSGTCPSWSRAQTLGARREGRRPWRPRRPPPRRAAAGSRRMPRRRRGTRRSFRCICCGGPRACCPLGCGEKDDAHVLHPRDERAISQRERGGVEEDHPELHHEVPRGRRADVFYEGERIHDINTLFKWGKVNTAAQS